jgi:hypothetical protein
MDEVLVLALRGTLPALSEERVVMAATSEYLS